MMPCPNLRCTVYGTDGGKCCHDLNWSAMWTGKDMTGWFHEKYEVIYGLEQMIESDVMT
jgi:hypothetical protein